MKKFMKNKIITPNKIKLHVLIMGFIGVSISLNSLAFFDYNWIASETYNANGNSNITTGTINLFSPH